MEITARGLETLEADPLAEMISAINTLEPKACAAFLDTLSQLSETLSDLRGARAFGTCGACTYYAQSDARGYCACVAAELVPEDFGKLCVNFDSGGVPPRLSMKTDKGQRQ